MSTQYSNRLGYISDEQFQQALDRFNLGRFIKATPITQGLWGQNVYVTSDKGEYVLRGVPHFDWQFKTEKVFVDLLKKHTQAPVPYPYLLDTDTSIFGWEYVLMTRMEGINLSDDLHESGLTNIDRKEIAIAQGDLLKELQKLTNPFCGKYDSQKNTFVSYQPNWIEEYKRQILEMLEKSASYNSLTPPEDISWVKYILAEREAFLDNFIPTFHMQDFKPGNMVTCKTNGKWQITGIFDFMEVSFGHPEADLSRMFAIYLDNDRLDLFYTLIYSYLQGKDSEYINRLVKRFPLFMFHDRLLIWEWAQRSGKAWWDKELHFKEWIAKYLAIEPIKLAR